MWNPIVTLILSPSDDNLPIRYGNAFPELVDATTRQVAASSARIYGQTYTRWCEWCRDQQIDPFNLRPAHVLAFLVAQPVAKSTRQRQLSALRKLAQMLYI